MKIQTHNSDYRENEKAVQRVHTCLYSGGCAIVITKINYRPGKFMLISASIFGQLQLRFYDETTTFETINRVFITLLFTGRALSSFTVYLSWT